MPNLSVNTNAGTVSVRYADAPKLVSSTASKVMQRIGLRLHAHLVKVKLRGGAIGVRTGNLSRSAFYRVELHGDTEIVTRIGLAVSKAKYARVQEEGGTIRPTGSRYLTIPIGAALTGKGVARFSARELIANPGNFGYLDTFFHRQILFGVKERRRRGEAVGGYGSIEPLFVLKSSVTLRPRRMVAGTLVDNLGVIREELGLGIDDIREGLE